MLTANATKWHLTLTLTRSGVETTQPQTPPTNFSVDIFWGLVFNVEMYLPQAL